MTTYEYDKHNNWTKRFKYDNGELRSITTRIISYYDNNSTNEYRAVPYISTDVQPKLNNCIDDNCFGVELRKILKQSIPKSRYIEFDIGKSKKINLNFVIEADGSFSNILVYRASKGLKEFIVSKIASLKASEVGYKNGAPVRTVFSMPLIIE